MTVPCFPYGFPRQFWTDYRPANRAPRPLVPRCVNSEPGSFNHECGCEAVVVGIHADGRESCYCARCAEHGHEGRRAVSRRPLYARWDERTA